MHGILTIQEQRLDQRDVCFSVRHFGLSVGGSALLHDISIDVYSGEILTFIGRAGAGKSNLLRAMCRLFDGERGLKCSGEICFAGDNIYAKGFDLEQLRRRVGFVPRVNCPFATSIWENVGYGVRLNGIARVRSEISERVEAALRLSRLWDEVKDDLHRKRGTELTESQQRRLCLARVLAIRPEVILIDCSSGGDTGLDHETLAEILVDIRQEYTVVCASSSLREAARISDRVAFFDTGRLIEVDTAEMILAAPLHGMTQDFIANSPE